MNLAKMFRGIIGGVLLAGTALTGTGLTGIGSAFAFEAGDILVRFRGIGIFPTGDSDGIQPDLTTTTLDPQPMGVPELDFTYMVTENIGVELILATSPHDLDAEGGAADLGVGTAASVWLLPPTLLLQYHFFPDKKFQPYVGAGVNVTFTYLENADDSYEAVVGPTDIQIGNSIGWAVQAGIDYQINDRWFANIDIKYVDINVDATLTSGFGTRTKRRVSVDINPIIFGVGVGYRF